MSRRNLTWQGWLSVLAGALMVFNQPAILTFAQTPSPLSSPVTPAYTPPPTFTPQPTFTPLPPTLAPTEVPPMPTTPGPTIDPNFLIAAGALLLFIVLLALWRFSRARRREDSAAQTTAPVKPVAPPQEPQAALEFTDAAGKVISLPLNKPVLTLGRADDNDLIIPGSLPNADTVSQHHAQFRRDQADYIVRDLGTPNGLTVNGRHSNHNLLQDGDRVSFGGVEAVFRKSGGAA